MIQKSYFSNRDLQIIKESLANQIDLLIKMEDQFVYEDGLVRKILKERQEVEKLFERVKKLSG